MNINNKFISLFVSVMTTAFIIISIFSAIHHTSLMLINAMLPINIVIFGSFRGIADIKGIYNGLKRYLFFRKLIMYILFSLSAVLVVLYRIEIVEIYYVLIVFNTYLSFYVFNAFFFGKTRGKFLWSKFY